MGSETSPALGPESVWGRFEPVVREKVIVEGKSFDIFRPAVSDRPLDPPAQNDPSQTGPYTPYWADLWPASRMLAKAILHEPWAPGLPALEVGCGLGLPGIVALSVGLCVTFSDYDNWALLFAAENARRNGFTDFRTLQLDWRRPPADLRLPVILGSDLIYELCLVEPLVDFLKKVLAPDGLCLLTDQDRVPSHALRDTLAREGLVFTTQVMRAGEPGGRRVKGTLYRISKS